MFLFELFKTMRARRFSSQRYNEEGAEIIRRLLEAANPKLVEAPYTTPASGIMTQNQAQSEKER